MRDIIPSIDLIPVKKLYCKFDISGDTKEAVLTNKHAVKNGACNMFEIITLDIDIPFNIEFSPVLTVYVYDNMMGILGSRLLGITNIPLVSYCEKVLESMNQVKRQFINAGDESQLRGMANNSIELICIEPNETDGNDHGAN